MAYNTYHIDNYAEFDIDVVIYTDADGLPVLIELNFKQPKEIKVLTSQDKKLAVDYDDYKEASEKYRFDNFTKYEVVDAMGFKVGEYSNKEVAQKKAKEVGGIIDDKSIDFKAGRKPKYKGEKDLQGRFISRAKTDANENLSKQEKISFNKAKKKFLSNEDKYINKEEGFSQTDPMAQIQEKQNLAKDRNLEVIIKSRDGRTFVFKGSKTKDLYSDPNLKGLVNDELNRIYSVIKKTRGDILG